MPYVSDKQRRFFHTDTAKKKGITEEMVHEYDTASKGKKLPEEAKPKKSLRKKGEHMMNAIARHVQGKE